MFIDHIKTTNIHVARTAHHTLSKSTHKLSIRREWGWGGGGGRVRQKKITQCFKVFVLTIDK